MPYRYLPNSLIGLCLLMSLGSNSLGADLDDPPNRGAVATAAWTPVSDERLGSMRGGFEVLSGLLVSFGIVRTVTINGDLVSQTHFELPDLTHITPEQSHVVGSALTEAGTIVQNGAGNSVADGLRSALGLGTVVQNTLSDQQIQTLTVVNAGVNTLGLFKSLQTQTTLMDALTASLGGR